MADDPTARTSGWWDSLFGEPQRHARQPQSRGALLGMGAYQNMPNANSSITDQRSAPIDLATEMRKEYPGTANYAPSMAASRHQAWSDPMLDIGVQLSDGGSLSQNPDDAYDYKSSFSQNWHPRATGQAPYNSFRIPMPYGDEAFGTGNMGPNLPRGGGNLDTSVGGGSVGYPSDLPYIGAHLPIAPGDPHWTAPPSPSGPHNRGGDPARPGYDNNVLPMDLSSIPGMTLNSVPQGWQ